MAKGDAVLRAAHPLTVLSASGAVWTAGAILHHAHVSALDLGLVSLAVAGFLYGTKGRPLALMTATTGTWLAAASAYGVLAGPDSAVSLLWGSVTLAALAAIRRSGPVRDAKQWRAARFEWLRKSHRYGLYRSHLIEHETTRLGDRRVYDTSDTGLLASRIASGDLAERIAQDEGLPLSRVLVRSPRPGRVEVQRRFRDPWARPIPHPVLTSGHELDLPVPCSIRDPLPVGQDPNTGAPLNLVLWDSDGGKTVVVVGKKGSGKTTLANGIRERVTAARDAELWNINVSKGAEDREWAPACHRSAAGFHEKAKAAAMLRELRGIIDERGSRPRDTKVFQPTEDDPAIVLEVDEVDAARAIGPRFRDDLDYASTKGRSESVTVIVLGQRGTADFTGPVIRSQADTVVLGKVGRKGEAMHAAGEMGLSLPDMGAYGEGHAGVWVILDDGGWAAGRAFNLCELTDIRKIAVGRALVAAESAAHEPGQVLTRSEPEPLSVYDGEHGSLDDALPPELRERLAELDAQNADTRRLLDQAAAAAASAPEVHPEDLAASTAERWRQAMEGTPVPEDAREPLLAMLGEGTSIRRVAAAFEISRWTAALWLKRLEAEGLARLDRRGRGSRWLLTDGDDQRE